jgi:hypothetical protein
MDRESRLAISTTSTETHHRTAACATLGFAGDKLDPAEISAVLPVHPTRAHRKDEVFHAGKRAGELRGRTGLWFFDTDGIVQSDHLLPHLTVIHDLLWPAGPVRNARVMALRDVLRHSGAHAQITAFWRGPAGYTQPIIPDTLRRLAAELGADIETDFATEEA